MKGLPKEIADRLEYKTVNGDHQVNATISKIHHTPKPCEDCGIEVVNRRLEARLQKDTIPSRPPKDVKKHIPKHWSLTCKNCKMKRNLDTGKFDIPANQYRSYLTERKKQMDK